MKKTVSLLAGACCALILAPAMAKAPDKPLGSDAEIPFANHGGIRNFVVENSETLLIEGTGGRWYRAELFSPCHDLPFTETIGFVTRGTDSFDKFSKILVRGQSCQVRSLVTAAKPLSRKERKALADKQGATL
jgi:hypothetical protein